MSVQNSTRSTAQSAPVSVPSPSATGLESDAEFFSRHARQARESRDRWMAWARQDREAAAAYPTQRDAFLSLVSQNVQSARRCSREAVESDRLTREAQEAEAAARPPLPSCFVDLAPEFVPGLVVAYVGAPFRLDLEVADGWTMVDLCLCDACLSCLPGEQLSILGGGA